MIFRSASSTALRWKLTPSGPRQLAQAKSLREIIDGLACCEGKLNHLGLQEGPKRSTLSYANGKRPWQLFEQVFYDQLGLVPNCINQRKNASFFAGVLLL